MAAPSLHLVDHRGKALVSTVLILGLDGRVKVRNIKESVALFRLSFLFDLFIDLRGHL